MSSRRAASPRLSCEGSEEFSSKFGSGASRKSRFNTMRVRSEGDTPLPRRKSVKIFYCTPLRERYFSAIQDEDLGSCSIMTPSGRPCSARIRDRLHELPPTERRLADLVLDFPGELASFRPRSWRRSRIVSNATVSRFIRRLGYDNYDEARRHAREAIREAACPVFSSPPSRLLSAGLAVAHEQQSHANLAATFNRISDALLTEVADAILAARKVRLVGYRNSHFLAGYLRWQLIQVREYTSVIPGSRRDVRRISRPGSHISTVSIIFGSPAPGAPACTHCGACGQRGRENALHHRSNVPDGSRSRQLAYAGAIPKPRDRSTTTSASSPSAICLPRGCWSLRARPAAAGSPPSRPRTTRLKNSKRIRSAPSGSGRQEQESGPKTCPQPQFLWEIPMSAQTSAAPSRLRPVDRRPG